MTTTKPQSTTEPPERIWLEQQVTNGAFAICWFRQEPSGDPDLRYIEYTRSPASTAPVVDNDELDVVARRAAERAFAIMQRYCACANSTGVEPLPLSPDDLAEIQKRRAAMLFPDGRPTGPWLDIDRLLAHVEALRLAVNVRTNAINLQLETIKELRAPSAAATAAPQCSLCDHESLFSDEGQTACKKPVRTEAAKDKSTAETHADDFTACGCKCVFSTAAPAKPRSNHFPDEALNRGFPDHISTNGTAYYGDGTVLQPTAAPVEQSDEVTLRIPTCGKCPFVDHSGAFTPGGAQPICGHRDAPDTFAAGIAGDERFHWKYRQVALACAPPEKCPLRQPVTDNNEGAR